MKKKRLKQILGSLALMGACLSHAMLSDAQTKGSTTGPGPWHGSVVQVGE